MAKNQPLEYKKCMKCGSQMPVYPGYVIWCEKCGWNIFPVEQDLKKDMRYRVYKFISRISSKNLLDSIIKSDGDKKDFFLERFLLFSYAALIYLISFSIIAGMFATGVFLILKGTVFHKQISDVGFAFIGVLLIVITYFLIPKFKYHPETPLDKEKFKAIYSIVEQLSEQLGTKMVDEIVVDCEFNASYYEPYFKKKKILHIGLPLFYILSNEEKIALLAHELAHGANKDVTNNKFICIADELLKKWYFLMQPSMSYKEIGFLMFLGPFLFLLCPIRWILSKLIQGSWYLFVLLEWRCRQRAEYLADYTASRVSGSEPSINTLEKFHYSEIFVNCMVACARSRYSNDILVEFINKVANVPDMEIRRIKRLETEYFVSIEASHPPTVFRIEFMKNNPCDIGFKISEEDAVNLEQELELLRKGTEQQLIIRSKEYAMYS